MERGQSVVYRCRCRPVTDTVPTRPETRDSADSTTCFRRVSERGYRFQGTQKYLMRKGHTLSAQRAQRPTEVHVPAGAAPGPRRAGAR